MAWVWNIYVWERLGIFKVWKWNSIMWENIGDGRAACNYYIMLTSAYLARITSTHQYWPLRGCETFWLPLLDISFFLLGISKIFLSGINQCFIIIKTTRKKVSSEKYFSFFPINNVVFMTYVPLTRKSYWQDK